MGRGERGERVLFDGVCDLPEGWTRRGLVGLQPRCMLRVDARNEAVVDAALECIQSELAARRAPGADGATGLAVLLAFESLSPGVDGSFPAIAAFTLDRSIVVDPTGSARLTVRAGSDIAAARAIDRWSARLLEPPAPRAEQSPRVRDPRSSLPRRQYIDAVTRLQRWIAEGHIYQANLCQRFDAAWEGDPLCYYDRLAAEQKVPRSAFVSIDGSAVASLSPETFVTVDQGVIETFPIKGTRPRGASAAEDRRAIEDLRTSPKDRAELLMIVDLERNDLGRICRPGTVEVPALADLRSFPEVHHLVARVRGRLREGIGWTETVRAIFPGGSITGAPKESAIKHLRQLEPVSRGPFTGGLFWCGDDGSIDSSILIRSAVFGRGHVSIGAGGGIVADSDPEAEWAESNHKARALTRPLGFDPEDLV
jgi:para-aminobenzoate synthetase component 1